METEILRKLVAISTAIYEAQGRDDLLRALDQACPQFGYDRFLLSCRPAKKWDVIVNTTITTFPDDFRHDYDRLNWVEGDIYTERALQPDDTFFWNCKEERYPDLRKQGYMDFLKDGPITNGVISPIHHLPGSASIFAMTSLKGIPPMPETKHATRILATFAIAKAETLGLCSSISADEVIALRSLSRVQQDVLNWIAEGKSNIDIATIMALPERTVRYHVSQILRKLGVVTRSQAVAIRKAGPPPP